MQNLVVVQEVDIEFKPGLTVLTGETGTGKSILIEALGLALGERAERQLVRQGAERAVVTASFDVGSYAPALDFLREHALDDGDDCILRRVLSSDGRSRAFCNASPVSVATLRQLAELLVDIHAQHAGQRLTQREFQRQLLDAYGGLQAQFGAVRSNYLAWKKTYDELAGLERNGAERARIDLLRYQVDELDNAQLDAEELATIENEFKKLANSNNNLEHCAALRQALYADEGGAVSALGSAASRARAFAKSLPEAANLQVALEQAETALLEVERELDIIEASLSVDPQRVQQLDRRLNELHQLARKHHVGLADLGIVAKTLGAELTQFDQQCDNMESLRAELDLALARYEKTAASLSKKRAQAALKMNVDISTRMRELGIPHANFVVSLHDFTDEAPQPHGSDRVEFMVSTNPAQPVAALNKVASGGELSRITLAIQAATAQHSGVPVAVYDEVDTGIGGNTANIVGRSLRDVSRHNQVICITHSPQVASAGDHHLLVEKQLVDGQSATNLRPLETLARAQEIARMLGAAKMTKSSLAHARDLIARAHS